MNRIKAKKSTLPAGSLAAAYLPADYTDVFACEVDSPSEITPDDVMVGLWADLPGWVNALFRLRNFLVRFVGLKGSENDDQAGFERCIRTGGRHGGTSLVAKNGNETVLLLADTHLDAYLSVVIEQPGGERRTVSAITLVRFKNRLGRVYFFFVRPFHGPIVKSMLRRSVERKIK